MQEKALLNQEVCQTRYPLRAIRYWWVGCALADEWERLRRPLEVVDVGCGRGKVRQFVGHDVPARWVGLDWRLPSEPLLERGYAEVSECDFDQRLPLPDNSADVVVFLHVIEHLPRPAETLAEISRILRPGGLLLAGSPVAPAWIARVRQRQLRKELSRGERRPGRHINCLWPARWRRLLQSSGLTPEFISGAYFLRWGGNWLENWRGWLRFNQAWGATFPALGGEVYALARKHSPATAAAAARESERPLLWLTPARAWGWALAGILVATSFLVLPRLASRPCELAQLMRSHQDGNDDFYVVDHPLLNRRGSLRDCPVLTTHNNPQHVITEACSRGRDAHFLVTQDRLGQLASSYAELRVVGEAQADGQRVFLLGAEGYGQPISSVVD